MNEQITTHFSRSEFRCRCGCGFDQVDMTLANALESLRQFVGRPIFVIDGCRCPTHNRAVGGAVHSQHLLGKAADIAIDGYTPRQIYEAAAKIAGLHGFGVADHQGFVHVDVRSTPARWCYDTAGREIPWYEPHPLKEK